MIKNITSTSYENKIKNVLLDNDECWFSSHNEEQIITIDFDEETLVNNIIIEYQKGFGCEKGELILINKENISICPLTENNLIKQTLTKIEIKLKKSQDLYNRFCIYRIIIN